MLFGFKLIRPLATLVILKPMASHRSTLWDTDPGSHFDAKRACSIRTCPLLAQGLPGQGKYKIPPEKNIAFSERSNCVEMALSMPRARRGVCRRARFCLASINNVMPAWFYILRLKSCSLYIGSITGSDPNFTFCT